MQQIETVQMDKFISDSKIPIRIAFVKLDGTPSIISLWYEQIGGKNLLCNKTNSKNCHISSK